MRASLKSKDERVWVSIEKAWTVPSVTVAGVDIPNDVSTWIKDEIAICN